MPKYTFRVGIEETVYSYIEVTTEAGNIDEAEEAARNLANEGQGNWTIQDRELEDMDLSLVSIDGVSI